MRTRLPSLKGHRPPIFGQCPLWPNGHMDYDATWCGGRPPPSGPGDIVFHGDPAAPRKKAHHPTQFLAHVYCGQTAGWMKTPLGTEVDLCPGHIILGGVPGYSQLPRKGHRSPSLFGLCLLWPRSPISATAELLFTKGAWLPPIEVFTIYFLATF